METANNNAGKQHRKPLEKMSYAEKGRFFKLRNILNTIFILMVIVGMAVWFFSSNYVGGAILIVSVFVKLTESVLRLIH